MIFATALAILVASGVYFGLTLALGSAEARRLLLMMEGVLGRFRRLAPGAAAGESAAEEGELTGARR